jgi:RNA polymerase sigma factor (sigma-70 family)
VSDDIDLDLLRRVSERDREAFESLYHRYYRRLFGFVHRLSRRPEVVEEVVNDVLLTVWHDAARFDGRSRVSSWIFGIAYHKALKAVGRESRDRSRHIAVEAAADERDRGPGPESRAATREAARVLALALAELSREQRTVVELTYYEGLSYPEISELVGCPVNTVKTRMFHARRRLRDLLPTLGLPQAAVE